MPIRPLLPLAAAALLLLPVAAGAQPTAASPEPGIGSPPNASASRARDADLPTYARGVSGAEQRLRQALSAVEAAPPATRQGGSVPPDVIQLTQALNHALEVVGRAPQSFENDRAYVDAERSLREQRGTLSRGSASREEAVAAAREALGVLEGLRRAAGGG